MSTEIDQVLVSCLSLNSDGQEAFICIPLATTFPRDDQFIVDHDDAYMKDMIVLETDTVEFLEDVFVDNIDPPKMMRPASKTVIEGLEKVNINGTSLVSCLVCFEDFSIVTEAGRLPCSHIYHIGCIVKWLKESNACPLCRYKMSVVDFDLNSTMPALDPDVDSKDMIADDN
ncbi:E3 ubiquitin-protein ligase RNF115-like [Durio zibethinus]|uniref:RING-type E3 ubiquitin transferase n=1 Tax=Durio zibethinus TaxID=66656 RepID=A0A6P5Y0Y3_DURZI|nr:E3 ubiquitin-protein ligase RNF115-like [Durio zibethinus]